MTHRGWWGKGVLKENVRWRISERLGLKCKIGVATNSDQKENRNSGPCSQNRVFLESNEKPKGA